MWIGGAKPSYRWGQIGLCQGYSSLHRALPYRFAFLCTPYEASSTGICRGKTCHLFCTFHLSFHRSSDNIFIIRFCMGARKKKMRNPNLETFELPRFSRYVKA